MSAGPTFERVYGALRQQLVSGRFAPGSRLDPKQIGDTLFASVTPVRDALHRLAGERIVEVPRNDGFRVAQPTEAALRELYGWRQRLLEMAIYPNRRQLPAHRKGQEQLLEGQVDAALLFAAIARRSGSHEIETAIGNANDRLGPFSKSECLLFEGFANELAELTRAFLDDERKALKLGIARWHRTRQRAVPLILELAADLGTIAE